MAQSAAPTAFQPPEIPWLTPQPLAVELDLGEGLILGSLRDALVRLWGESTVQAVVAFGSRARGEGRLDSELDLAVICREPSLEPQLKTQRWSHYRNLLGRLL